MNVSFRQYRFFGGNMVTDKAHRGHIFSGFTTQIKFSNLRIAFRIFALEVILCIIVSTRCYTKIDRVLRQTQAHLQHNVHQGQQNGGQDALNMAQSRTN